MNALAPPPHPNAFHPFRELNLTLDTVGRGWVDERWSRSEFSYPYDRLYQFLSGRATVLLRGGGRLSMRPGNLYWLPAFVLAEIRCSTKSEHRYLHFRRPGGDERLWFGATAPALETRIEDGPLVAKLMDRLGRSWESPRADDVIACEAALRYLLSPFFRGSFDRLSDLERFRPVLELLERSISRAPSVLDLAATMGLDVDYFSARFKKALGLAPKAWILSRRLQKAASLLWDTPMKIREVAAACGFDDEAYFARVFHQRLGLSPSAYRKRRRE
jgi:AraC-like DNA-binding protein